MTSDNEDKEHNFIELSSENLNLIGVELVNGFFISISKNDEQKLGTTAITLPNEDNNANDMKRRRNLITATVIGSRNELFAKALAEKLAYLTNKIIYLSVFFDENNDDLFKESLQLIEKIAEK